MACGVAIGLTMAGGTMLMGQSQRHRLDAEEMWVRKVVIVDEKGLTRGVIGMSTDGASGFVFRDAKHRDRAVLEVRPDGPPTISLNGSAGADDGRVTLWVDEKDNALASVAADDEVGMAATVGQGAAVMLLRGRHRPVASWGIDGDGRLAVDPVTAPRTSP